MELIIRQETEKDWFESEFMTKKAFWNLHKPGCDEHYLVHKLRKDEAYIPKISRVVEYAGKVIGAIYYLKAHIVTKQEKFEILTFGPLCVEPEYQRKGVGTALMKTTLQLARDAGYPAIIITGEPDYYPRFGFLTCDHFRITTPDGKNFPAFMGLELIPGSFQEMPGIFLEPEVFESLDPADVEEYDKKFPFMQKLKLPGQWE